MNVNKLKNYFPIFEWGVNYNKLTFSNDIMAALIVTIMLVPQSLAYAMLAGLPPEMGLYASMLPIILYAIFGTSRTLAVGPVAVVSLLTAASIGKFALPGSSEYIIAAITLAFMSGIFLIILGFFKLGFLANFLSHPVISGFITASGIIIVTSQLKHILGVNSSGHNLIEIISVLFSNINDFSFITFAIGISTILFLFWVRNGLYPLLLSVGFKRHSASLISKIGPVAAIIASTIFVWFFKLDFYGVKIVGEVPKGLPSLSMPSFSFSVWNSLIGSAILLSLIGFVESISVAQTLAAKRRQRINPDQELIGLGMANLGAAFSSGLPVTGGFSRSVVNYDAGAETPAAGAFTAIGLCLVSLFLTPLIFFLPKATLAATIIVAVISLIDFSILKKTWFYSKADFMAVFLTILVTLVIGVEAGVIAGILTSILIHIFKTSRPHIAVVGQVPKTEHFRNVSRHNVITDPKILTIRVDESLYFANTRFLEDRIYKEISKKLDLEHVVIMCSAINTIDMSALASLELINERLIISGVKFHLSEVKGPVLDKLKGTNFINKLSGQIFQSQFQTNSLTK